jgi:hypothetical protein
MPGKKKDRSLVKPKLYVGQIILNNHVKNRDSKLLIDPLS